jgi:quercetin dioxygenase-like cupin family protein
VTSAGHRGLTSACTRPATRRLLNSCAGVGGRVMRSVRPWEYRGERTMSDEQVAPETRGVTVKLLATVDLGPEIEGMAGRQLRMRMVTIEPGGVLGPLHDHKDRPGTVYILQGTITDHRNGVATDYGPGVGWPEDRNTTHWLENRGTIPAVEVSVDIVRQE